MVNGRPISTVVSARFLGYRASLGVCIIAGFPLEKSGNSAFIIDGNEQYPSEINDGRFTFPRVNRPKRSLRISLGRPSIFVTLDVNTYSPPFRSRNNPFTNRSVLIYSSISRGYSVNAYKN